MKKKCEFELEKVFKMVMNDFYDEINYDYYSRKLDVGNKMEVVECLLNEANKHENNKINFKAKVEKILSNYYECPIKGNEFIVPIKNMAGLTKEEKDWIENIYDMNRVYLLYNHKNIRVIVQLSYNIDREAYWDVCLLDFINDDELVAKQKYQVYMDIYDMLMNEC